MKNDFSNDDLRKVMNEPIVGFPEETPPELTQACANIDLSYAHRENNGPGMRPDTEGKMHPVHYLHPAWPIQSNLEALRLLAWWEKLHGRAFNKEQEVYRLTHSHAGEFTDLETMGYDRLYIESIYTKYVSISWHLAGRYDYDQELLALTLADPFLSPPHDDLRAAVEKHNKKLPRRLIDFGAAPWIQSIFYARLGYAVTAVNQSVESDSNRFGRFLAQVAGVEQGNDSSQVQEFSSSDPAWGEQEYDVIYAIDVLEHIPPLADGSPGWVSLADKLKEQLVSIEDGGLGIWYVNAPLEISSGPVKPVSTHPSHWTSPISTQEWAANNGLINGGGYFSWRKP